MNKLSCETPIIVLIDDSMDGLNIVERAKLIADYPYLHKESRIAIPEINLTKIDGLDDPHPTQQKQVNVGSIRGGHLGLTSKLDLARAIAAIASVPSDTNKKSKKQARKNKRERWRR